MIDISRTHVPSELTYVFIVVTNALALMFYVEHGIIHPWLSS